VDLYAQALELAPDDPAILVGNALACVRHWYFGGVGTADLARVAAERAVTAAPNRGEARLALAAVRFQEGRVVDAVREVRRALRLSPALADAHELLGRILAETGPARLAEAHLSSASRLEPLLYHARWTSARLAALAGRWDEAQAIVDLTIEENAMSGGWLYAARLAFWRADAAHAATLLARPGLSAPDNEVARRIVAHVAGVEPIDVDRLFDPSLGSAHASGRSYVFLHQARGEFLIGTGRLEDGLESLDRAATGGLLDLVWLDLCPVLAPVRTDPRFAAIRETVATRSDEVARVLDESLS
jgi:serine/threonine-protein kinase